MRLSEYVLQVVNDPKYGHDLEWVKGNLRRAHIEKIEAEHDRQVAERAWDEGYEAGRGARHHIPNPYRAAKGERVTIPARLTKADELGPAIRKLLVDEARDENRRREDERARELFNAAARNRAAKGEQK